MEMKELVVEGSVLQRGMAPPKVAMTSLSGMKKQHTKLLVASILEGTSRASESEPSSTNFSKEYIPPRKLTTKLVG